MSQAVQLSHHWTHPDTGVEYQPREVVTLDDRLAARLLRSGFAFPTTGPDRRGFRTWYVDSDRDNVDWSVVVQGGAAVQRIYRLRVWQDGTDAEELTLWANLGAGVPPERITDAREDAETTTPPPPLVRGDGTYTEGPSAESLPLRPGAGIVLRIVDGEVEVSIDPAYVLDPGTPPPPATAAPTVTLADPAAGTVLSGYVTFAGSYAAEAGLRLIELVVDGQVVSTAAATSTSWTAGWESRFATDGPHEVTARITDGVGRAATATPRTYVADNAAPEPEPEPDRPVGYLPDYFGAFL